MKTISGTVSRPSFPASAWLRYTAAMQLVFATRNAHKLEEVAALLDGSGIRLVGLDHYPELGEIPEDHDTFEANALQKAQVVFEHTGLPVVADDSGLEVDALNGAPGVHSKRFSPEATAASNNALLLERLDGVADRRGRFRCVLALLWDGGHALVDGRCEGRIGRELQGEHGFGYDPLFLPDEAPGRSMAELSMQEKNAISHRGRAFSGLPQLLVEHGLAAG